ncbi:MAG TPA: hypothetical protein VKP60_08740 [Magnetospirillaceae bacterium]|nr:hypothetical protein [Magnetospirillaceae bacterium]
MRFVTPADLLRMVVVASAFALGGTLAAAQDSAPRADAASWAALAALPDFSGVWIPDVPDQIRQQTANPPPWRPEILPQIAHLVAEEKAGRPFLVLSHCLPHGMPSWMLINHNAFEILLTPGRVTLLGEVDGNRMRRIHTDGRSHPRDPDLSLHGDSIGKWVGDTLVVDTEGVLPQAYIATSEAIGVPNNGGMHIVERLHLAKPDLLYDDLEITAPKVLSSPWKTTRIFHRYRNRPFEITEGECVQEELAEGTDSYGNAIFVSHPQNPDGSVRPPQ